MAMVKNRMKVNKKRTAIVEQGNKSDIEDQDTGGGGGGYHLDDNE